MLADLPEEGTVSFPRDNDRSSVFFLGTIATCSAGCAFAVELEALLAEVLRDTVLRALAGERDDGVEAEVVVGVRMEERCVECVGRDE